MKRLFTLLLLVFASQTRAATFLVPADRDLVGAAKAIVVATAGESYGRYAPKGWIETVTELRVDESIKGSIIAGDTIRVTELGGVVGGVGYLVPGSPTYARGERVLLFLDTNGRGEWVSKNMAVGKFTQRGRLLQREQLCGWDYDGTPHVEEQRLADPFLDFVRQTARGGRPRADYFVHEVSATAGDVTTAAAPASTYLLQWNGTFGNFGIRWKTFPTPVVFYSNGTQPGATGGGQSAMLKGLAAWTNDPDSNIVYSYGGSTNINSTGFGGGTFDGTNVILFNDPSDEIPGSFTGHGGDTLAIGGAWFDDRLSSSYHTYAGERFYTIFEADLVVQNGITGAGLIGNGLDHVLTHELGHTLGLRHSDTPPAGGTFSVSAIMNSSVDFNNDPYGSRLQAWDKEAIAAVYGTAATPPPPCKPPQITGQPQSVDLGSAPVTLAVSVIGDTPFQYQWFIGPRGNASQPIQGANASQLAVQPALTTVYWVRISNGCDPPADSAAATVRVNGCDAVTVDSISPNVSVIEGTTVTLTARATGATKFQWYRGLSGVQTSPIQGATTASIDVKPGSTTAYWVRASNDCGAFSNSDIVVVNVTPCKAVTITVQPAGGSVVIGNSATLFAGTSGSQPVDVQWYQGAAGDTSHPIANGVTQTLTTPPLFATTSYWAHLSNLCGSANTATAVIAVVSSCTAPQITVQPHDTAVTPGATAVITVAASGTSLSYQWYQGPVFDFTTPLGGSAPALVTPPLSEATQFWVRITSPCGSVNSTAATVTPNAAMRRRSAGH